MNVIGCQLILLWRVKAHLTKKTFSHSIDFANVDMRKAISSSTLLGKEKSIVIVHDGQRYLLSMTKFRKLILTK